MNDMIILMVSIALGTYVGCRSYRHLKLQKKLDKTINLLDEQINGESSK